MGTLPRRRCDRKADIWCRVSGGHCCFHQRQDLRLRPHRLLREGLRARDVVFTHCCVLQVLRVDPHVETRPEHRRPRTQGPDDPVEQERLTKELARLTFGD